MNRDEMIVNAFATVRDLPGRDFSHRIMGHRDFSDLILLPHLDGFAGYVLGRGNGEMTSQRYQIWRHIQRVRHQLSFRIHNEDLPTLAPWAQRANAILFVEDGSVRAPDMTILMSGDGKFNAAAGPPFPQDAIERRSRTLKQLYGLTPQPPVSMSPSLSEVEVVLRSISEVWERALGLCCAAREAVAIINNIESSRSSMDRYHQVAISALTPQEKAFLIDEQRDEAVVHSMTWRFEALSVLLWALSTGVSLSPASTTVDVAAVAEHVDKLLMNGVGCEGLKLRPTVEILDLLDLTWRQHWIARQARQDGADVAALNLDVIMERHHALNWLTGFQNDRNTSWDDIEINT